MPSPGVSPSVYHEGLLVPNATGLTYPRMAEPDQIDFATAANAQWGVIEGLQVTISSFTVMVDSGCAVVNGKLVTSLSGGSVTLYNSGPQDRFDSVVINASGGIEVLQGVYATDPVFRDVPINNTLLAVVFCPTGAESLAGFVIDKRRFVAKSLLTKIGTSEMLVRNTNGGSIDHYRVTGDGMTAWEGDTSIRRKSVKTLEIDSNLELVNLKASGLVQGSRLHATQDVTGSNLHFGQFQDMGAPIGAIHQNPVNGDVSVMTPTGWQQLALVDGIMPVGSVIQSVEPPSVMNPKGWIQLDGTNVSESGPARRLFGLTAFQSIISGEAPTRKMTLPDATNRVLRGANTGIGNTGGKASISLTVAQMPLHKHNVSTINAGAVQVTGKTGIAGEHSHFTTTTGLHTHLVDDPGHAHTAQYPFGVFICAFWGGHNKIDAEFNDRNHTYSVEGAPGTSADKTGITINSATSGHKHDLSWEGWHEHPVTLNPIPDHRHNVSEDNQGSGAAIDIMNPYINVYTYIRV